MAKPEREIGRLALRAEGNWWVAYWAKPDTMDGALELARMNLQLVEHGRLREAFMAMMQEAAGDMLKKVLGAEVAWPNAPRPAPEHEKSGRG